MTETNNPSSANSGLTLIELLIAMAIASIMMAMIAGAYWAQVKTSREQQMVVAMQQNLRSAMYFLERDIKMAGYDSNPNDTVNATITLAQSDALTFEYVDDTDTQIKVAYDLFDFLGDGDNDLGRAVNDGMRQPIAENIEELEFFYTMADGTQTTDPASETPPEDLDEIRAVGISMLMRTASESGAPGNLTFTSLSGGVLGPFNDGIRRQLVTVTIKCRNMLN